MSAEEEGLAESEREKTPVDGAWLSGFGMGRIEPGKDKVEGGELAQGLKMGQGWGPRQVLS